MEEQTFAKVEAQGPEDDEHGAGDEDVGGAQDAGVFLDDRGRSLRGGCVEVGLDAAHALSPYSELRCYLRDPDGYLIEIGQTTGLLHGITAS